MFFRFVQTAQELQRDGLAEQRPPPRPFRPTFIEASKRRSETPQTQEAIGELQAHFIAMRIELQNHFEGVRGGFPLVPGGRGTSPAGLAHRYDRASSAITVE